MGARQHQSTVGGGGIFVAVHLHGVGHNGVILAQHHFEVQAVDEIGRGAIIFEIFRFRSGVVHVRAFRFLVGKQVTAILRETV